MLVTDPSSANRIPADTPDVGQHGNSSAGSSQRCTNEVFAIDHLRDNMKGHSVRGGAATLAAQGISFALRVGSTAVLARVLTPADFGLIAMVIAVIGFADLFRDFGLSIATIQREQITHDQVSSLFWINVALSAFLLLVMSAFAPVTAWFYGEPELVGITIALSSTFLIGGLAVQHQALLRRQMRFVSLAVIQVSSFAVGVLMGIAAALTGIGYWALVVMHVAQSATYTAIVWYMTRWVPGPPRLRSGIQSMVTFGGNVTGFHFSNYFARNTDKILIGWYWGALSLGLYSRAHALVLLPLLYLNGPVSAVTVPALSRLQSSPSRWANYYLQAISGVMLCAAPLIAFLLVSANDIILFVLGPQWQDAVGIFRWLSISALAQVLCNSTTWLYTSLGHGRRMLGWGLATSLICVLAFIIGLPFGTTSMAAIYSVAFLLLTWPSVVYACSGTSLRPTAVVKAITPQVTSAILAAAFTFLCRSYFLPELRGFSAIAFATCTFLPVYVGGVACFPNVRNLASAFMSSFGRM